MTDHSQAAQEPKQEGYPDSIAAEVYKLKRKATTMFHNDHDDGDTAIYLLLSELAPLIEAEATRQKIAMLDFLQDEGFEVITKDYGNIEVVGMDVIIEERERLKSQGEQE